jgi:hypothetical protein
MMGRSLRLASKLCVLGISVVSLARAERIRDARPRFALVAPSGGTRKVIAPLPPAIRRPGLDLPPFISLPGSGGGPNGLSPKHAALASNATHCATHCVERRSMNPALNVTSTVLAGVASAGLATGVVLVLTTSNRSERASLIPSFRFRFSAGALASARWRF